MTERILVTGGAGYIGAHACKALARAGYEPVTFDNLSTGWADAVRFGPFERGDLLDPERLAEVMARHRPAAVLHFAALSQVGEAARIPGRYWRNNVTGTLNLVEAALAAGCDRIVFSSTCATYGDHDGILLDESTPQRPTNAYGASKRAIEDMLGNFAEAGLLRHVTFRYFNVVGADPEGDLGEQHDPETHLVPLMFDAALGRRAALTIFGTDYPTPDGTCIRDYVHVCDLVGAHLLGLERLLSGGESRVYNLGTGRGFSVREMIGAAERVTGKTVPVIEGPRRPGDCACLVSGGRRAEAELGWVPGRALETIMADAWQWHQGPGYAG
ncbi:MAG: UDP-glucose 4-epimerase GalE [Alphaproteobacteria bacterium]|nr:MAG: UDP-glucose 4-epimerase GalE [Alphaproteobacteria bacterium]